MEQGRKKRKSTSAKAQDKMAHYLSSLLGDKEFLDAVAEIRRMFGIPKNGFEEELEDEVSFVDKLPPYMDKREEETSFEREVDFLASRHNLSLPWIDAVTKYVLYGQFFLEEIEPLVQWIDFSQALAEQAQYNEEPLLGEDKKEIDINILENIAEGFPIGIFISPNATRNDIIDYVKKYYITQVEPAQIKYRDEGSKIGKVRGRSEKVRERDNFIYEHKDLSSKKITTLVRERFGDTLEYDYINKIITRKNKKDKK